MAILRGYVVWLERSGVYRSIQAGRVRESRMKSFQADEGVAIQKAGMPKAVWYWPFERGTLLAVQT